MVVTDLSLSSLGSNAGLFSKGLTTASIRTAGMTQIPEEELVIGLSQF